jgi:translocation and assembly module TamB
MFNLRRLLLLAATLLIVAAIVAPAALVWSALYTTAGLQFVVRQLPRQFAGVTLEITGVRGTVAEGLEVERVEITHELVHLKFEGISGRVTLAPLLLQTLRVPRASISRALIEVKRRNRPSSPGAVPFLPRWMIINAEDAQVASATLTVPNGFRMDATELRGAAVLRHSYIRFFQAEALLWGGHASAIGELRATDPFGMDVKGHFDWTPAGQPNWTVYGSARGDLDVLHIVAHTASPFRADFSGQMLELTNRWHWAGDAVVRDLDLRAWGAGDALGSITGHLAGSGDGAGFSAHGPLDPAGLHAGAFETQFSGDYAAHVLTGRHIEVRHASGARASGSGTIGFVEPGPRLQLSGSWNDFRWPLVGRTVAFSSESGTFTLSGALPFKVHASGSARVPDLPAMPLEVSGTLGAESFAFDAAEVDLFAGHASGSGLVAWKPRPTWSASGRATGINPGALRDDLPGSVNFSFGVSGNGFDAKGDFTAAFSDLSGKLRGVAASGGGTVTHSGSTWGFNNVRIGLGSASLALDGRVDERMDLRFAVSTQDLSVLAPGSRGSLKASGTLRGTLADPAILATAHGTELEYQGVKLAGIDADVRFDPGASAQESKVDAQLHKLAYGGRTLENLAFTLVGVPAAYRVHVTATAPGLAVSAQASGPYAHGVFKGQLDALNITGSEYLHLSLERPVGLSVSPEQARLEWLCLLGSPGSICADAEWTAAAWSTTIMANQLPLNTLTAGMTPAVEYHGTVNTLARLSGGGGASLVGSLRAELADADIAHVLVSHKIQHTRIGSGTVTVTATPSQITAQADLGDGEVGSLHGHLEVQRTTPRWQDMPASGELHAQSDQGGLLTLYAPDVDRSIGRLTADMQLAGTVGTPRMAGAVKVIDGEIDVYQVNLSLRQIEAQAQLGDSGIEFTGSAHAGSGAVTATGHLEWRELLPYGKFHLTGSNLRLVDVPEAQIDASPDLDFNIAGRRIEVLGKVAVPYAKIQPKDIANAVLASPDEIILGSDEEDPAKRFEVMSTITLSLGDRVSIDTRGLTGRLTGSLTIRSGYDAITRGTGELSVVEGKYTAYARKLDIKRGRLIFNGGPIDDPGVDLRATKEFPDVTAGVNVRGTLLQPRMSFFSDPPLPQSQVVSLILAGGSLESVQNRSTGNTGAGSAALAQGGAILAQQLGSHVGIEDVSLESDITSETSLVLGRYLSPRLYVSYGISLTQQLNTFKLRYTLGDHWTVKTEVGQARGADLVYAIEK